MVGNGDVAAETQQVLKNLVAVLKEAGATCTGGAHNSVPGRPWRLQTVNGLYAEVFGGGVSPCLCSSGSTPQRSKWKSTVSPGWKLSQTHGGIGWNWLQWSYASGKLTIGELEAGYPSVARR